MVKIGAHLLKLLQN